MISFIENIILRSKIEVSSNLSIEYHKLAIARVFLGFFGFVRVLLMTYSSLYYFDGLNPFILGIGLCILMFLLMIGLMTPLVSLTLILSYSYFSSMLHASTLGNSIFLLILICLFLCNSGLQLSVDSYLLKRKKWYSKILHKIYSVIGKPDFLQLKYNYFFLFFSYAIISFAAVTYHLVDENWLGGNTCQLLLTNSYLSKYFYFFREIENTYPNFFYLFSCISNFFQTVFQLFMILLIFFKIGKAFIKYWSLGFFLISLFFIQLSYLPHVEFIFWFILFFNGDTCFSPKSGIILKGSSHYMRKGMIYFFLLISIIYLPFKSHYPQKEILQNAVKKIHSDKIIETFLHIAFRIGFDCPVVFNKEDLVLGDNWVVIFKRESGEYKLVPFSGYFGEKLNYQNFDFLFFGNHNSDVLYFGNTSHYRRRVIDFPVKKYHERDEGGYQNIYRRLMYDYRISNHKNKMEYLILCYNNNSSNASMGPEKYTAKIIHSYRVEIEE